MKRIKHFCLFSKTGTYSTSNQVYFYELNSKNSKFSQGCQAHARQSFHFQKYRRDLENVQMFKEQLPQRNFEIENCLEFSLGTQTGQIVFDLCKFLFIFWQAPKIFSNTFFAKFRVTVKIVWGQTPSLKAPF